MPEAFDWEVEISTLFTDGFVPTVHIRWQEKTQLEVFRQVLGILSHAKRHQNWRGTTVSALTLGPVETQRGLIVCDFMDKSVEWLMLSPKEK